MNLLAFAALVPLALKIAADVLAQGTVSALDGFLRADALSALVIILTTFIALACAIYSIGYFRADARAKKITELQLRRYYALTPLFVAVMLLVPLADNLGVMWVAIESGTLSSVLLVAFYNQKTSIEAAWKYIIIGSIGISLALFGTIFTYYSAVNVLGAETQHGMNWSVLAGIADKFDPKAMRLAFILVLLGYGTKAGLAPMHTWKPDAYSEAPVPTAALLGTAFVNCAVYGIARFDILAVKCLGPEFSGRLLAWFGVASILVAAPFILTQRNFRRILAYSSIDHAGIMVAAIGFGGKLGALGAALHMVFHGVTKPLMFFCATGHSWLAFLFVAGAMTIFAGFLVHMVKMNLGEPRSDRVIGSTVQRFNECPWKLGAMMMVAAAVVALAFWLPQPLYQLVQQAAQIIGGAQ